MKNRRALKVLAGFSLTGLVLASTAGMAASGAYVPRASVHFKCVFSDGSYSEFKQREKWYPQAELTRHGQTTGQLDSKEFYVDPRGKRHEEVGTSDPECAGVGKPGGRIFWDNGFEDFQHRFIHWSLEANKPGDNAPSLALLPKEFRHAAELRADLRAIKEKESLYAEGPRPVIALGPQTLLFEQAMTALNHPTAPLGTVLYVYQAISNDYGKTWSTPVLTKDAKLYEIGRLMTAQSWSAKVVTIVKHK
ncbi:MAG: hypothetical protein V4631_10080 [Pseudomonadota bacterium]